MLANLHLPYSEPIPNYGNLVLMPAFAGQLLAKQNWTGVAKDDAESVKWWRKAAKQGFADAQFNLGVMYAQGDGGLLRSESAAIDWYYKSALSYIKEGDRDLALTCYDRMRKLDTIHVLTQRLAGELYDQAPDNRKSGKDQSDQSKVRVRE